MTASARLAALALLALLAPAALAQPQSPIVRVNVLGRVAPQRVTIHAGEAAVTLYADRAPTPVATLRPGESVDIERVGSRLRLLAPTAAVEARVVEAVPAQHAPLTLRTGTHHHHYHGAMSVELDAERRALRLVNYVPIEDYVASVVASEYPFPEIEGVKAQAVLARTYALRARDAAAPFDVSDDTGSQVYGGADTETAITRAATDATAGEVLSYRGALAEATYFSCDGGHTADNESVWSGQPVPYLRGRPDPYDAGCPDSRWTTTAAAGGVLRALSNRFGGTVTGFEIRGRSDEGRVTDVRLLGTGRIISGSAFRSVVNAAFGSRTVRSTLFTAERSGNRYVFTGRGFGHGVGMSQYGAREQARQGRSYRDILAFYFAGTDVQPFFDSYGAPPVRYASTERPPARPRRAGAAGTGESPAPARRTAW